MTGDTIECFNCGHENPSWAQVCRSCGYALQQAAPTTGGPAGLFPTDRDSLRSIGGAMGAIVLAIVLGLVLSGLIPPAPNIAAETPTPTPSPSASASASEVPTGSESASASAAASPALPGVVTFGTGWNNDTHQISGVTTAFTATSAGFAYSISLSEPIGVSRLQVEVIRRAADGKETVVQTRQDGTLVVDATLLTEGLKVKKSVSQLIAAWGQGTFILRVYNGGELLGQGTFTFS